MGAKSLTRGGDGLEVDAHAYATFVMQPVFQLVQAAHRLNPFAPEDVLTAFAVHDGEITGYGKTANGKPLSTLTPEQMSAVRCIQLLCDPRSDVPNLHLARQECLKVLAALNSTDPPNSLMALVLATIARELIEPLVTDDPVETLMQCAAAESKYQQLTRGLNSALSKDDFVNSPPSVSEVIAALGADPVCGVVNKQPPHMTPRVFKIAQWFYHLADYWTRLGDRQPLAAEYVRLVLKLVPAARANQGDIYSMLRSLVVL